MLGTVEDFAEAPAAAPAIAPQFTASVSFSGKPANVEALRSPHSLPASPMSRRRALQVMEFAADNLVYALRDALRVMVAGHAAQAPVGSAGTPVFAFNAAQGGQGGALAGGSDMRLETRVRAQVAAAIGNDRTRARTQTASSVGSEFLPWMSEDTKPTEGAVHKVAPPAPAPRPPLPPPPPREPSPPPTWRFRNDSDVFVGESLDSVGSDTDDAFSDDYSSGCDSWYTTPTESTPSIASAQLPNVAAVAAPISDVPIDMLAAHLMAARGEVPPAAPPAVPLHRLGDPHAQRPHTVISQLRHHHAVGAMLGVQAREEEASAVRRALGTHRGGHRSFSAQRAEFDSQRCHPLLLTACNRHAVVRPQVSLPGTLPHFVTAMANLPLPVLLPGARQLCYFEVEVAAGATSASATVPAAVDVCVGVAPGDTPLSGVLGVHPGSVCLTSKGMVVCGSSWSAPKLPSTFGVGAVVGVLVRWLTDGPWVAAGVGSTAVQLTFSVKGRVLALTPPVVVPPGAQLFPAVGVSSCDVRVFGHFTSGNVVCRRREAMVVGTGHSNALDGVTGTRSASVLALDGTVVLAAGE